MGGNDQALFGNTDLLSFNPKLLKFQEHLLGLSKNNSFKKYSLSSLPHGECKFLPLRSLSINDKEALISDFLGINSSWIWNTKTPLSACTNVLPLFLFNMFLSFFFAFYFSSDLFFLLFLWCQNFMHTGFKSAEQDNYKCNRRVQLKW